MVSDFIDEHSGFLAYNDEEYERAKAINPSTKKYGRVFLEYGENKEGHWTRDRFMEQIKQVVEMAELKYPPQDGWRHVWNEGHSLAGKGSKHVLCIRHSKGNETSFTRKRN